MVRVYDKKKQVAGFKPIPMKIHRLIRLGVVVLLLNGFISFGGALPAQAHGVPLKVTLTDSADPVLLGQTLVWDAVIANENPVKTAYSAVAHTMVPYGTHLISIDVDVGHCHKRHRYINCYLGHLHPGQAVHLQMTVKIQHNALYFLPEDALLRHAVTVTSFSRTSPGADAGGDAEQTLVLTELPEEPAEVIPKTIAVSPSCVEPGAKLTLFGEGFDILTLGENDVQIGGVLATILAARGTGIVVEVPQLPEGSATVNVVDVSNVPTVRISNQCNPREFTDQDVEAGFVSGDILIFFKEDPTPEELEAFRLEYGFKELVQHPLLGYYFAQLGDDDARQVAPPVINEPDAPVNCLINLRSSAQPVDLLLLVDRSGTMEASVLKPYVRELLNQMYCLINRESRISLMMFNEAAELAEPFAPWSEQSDILRSWADQPLQPRRQSNLENALNEAMGYVSSERRTGVSPQIMVLTRGPANPPIASPEQLIDRAVSSRITIHGLGFTSRFFDESNYAKLAAVTEGTGRELLLFDERDIARVSQVATCSIVYGIFGQDCKTEAQSESETEQTPTTETVTCSIVSGIYGVSTCGEGSLDLIPTLLVDRTIQVINALNNDPRVDEAFFNDLLDESQNDPDLLNQDWLLSLGLPQGWALFFPKQGEGTTIGIIDTGVDLTLNDSETSEVSLAEEAPEGLNFAPVPPEDNDQTADDDLGHGTAVSTIAASALNNGFNGAGVAPQANLMAFKVFAVVNGQVKASNDSVAQALMNAFVLGVDVVNMSLGCKGCSENQENQLRRFYDRIINNLFEQVESSGGKTPIIVAAAGNDGDPFLDSPAANPRVIAVGSVQPNLEERSLFSNYGEELDFLTLGENPLTTLSGGNFGNAGSGTSFSAPQVSGLVSLMLAEMPGMTFDEVMEKIKQCFVIDLGPPGFDEETGWGRIHIPTQAEDAAPGCLN